MTRIILQMFVIFLVEGSILLATGDLAVSAIADHKTESLDSPTNLTLVGNTSRRESDNLDFPVSQNGIKEENGYFLEIQPEISIDSTANSKSTDDVNKNIIDVTRASNIDVFSINKNDSTEIDSLDYTNTSLTEQNGERTSLVSLTKSTSAIAVDPQRPTSSIETIYDASKMESTNSETEDSKHLQAGTNNYNEEMIVNALEIPAGENETKEIDADILNDNPKHSVNSFNERQTSMSPKSYTRNIILNSTDDSNEETTHVPAISENDFKSENETITWAQPALVIPQHLQLVEDSSPEEKTTKMLKKDKSEIHVYTVVSHPLPDAEREINLREKHYEELSESVKAENYTEIPFLEMKDAIPMENRVNSFEPLEIQNSGKEADDNVNEHINHFQNEKLGVTFDPDGMTHDGPQEPDSVVFLEPTAKDTSDSPEREREFGEIATGKYLEPEFETVQGHMSIANRTNIIERMGSYESENISENAPKQSATLISEEEILDEEIEDYNLHYSTVTAKTLLAETKSKSATTNPISDESEEMLGDAPYFTDGRLHSISSFKIESISTTPKSGPKTFVSPQTQPNDISLVKHENPQQYLSTEKGSFEFPSHVTDQSVIRPVIVKIASPQDLYASTSILPESFSTENHIVSLEDDVFLLGKVENSSQDTFGQVILPNPAPILSEVEKDSNITNIVMHHELSDYNETVASYVESLRNSTIAGIAVKTSVSVSLPLSETNSNEALQLTSNGDVDSKNTSLVANFASESIEAINVDNSSTTTLEPSAENIPTTPSTATAFKIRKPKLKIGGGAEEAVSRKPFTPSLRRSSSTAGPPVSIFKKTRTRIASITSSTTARPLPKFSTIRIQYASHFAPGILPELIISTEPVTTTEPPTTTTEEPISELPFTDQTYQPSVSNEDDVTLIKVAGYMALDRGIRWNDLLDNRLSPEYKMKSELIHLHLERLFRSSPIATRLWKIEIDGFSGSKNTRPVGVDFFLYLIKNRVEIEPENLTMIFHRKLTENNTFAKFRVDTAKTAFELLQEEPLKKPTPPPEDSEEVEPPIPQWAIAVIVIGAASLIFIVLFATVTMYGRHHMRRRYSTKLTDEDRSSGDWESKMAAAYENMAADTIYDAEDLRADSFKKSRLATFHGMPATLKRCDSWSSDGWSTPQKHRKKSHH